MNAGSQLLVISERAADSRLPTGLPSSRLEYRFLQDTPEDGFSAWCNESGIIDVAETCRAITGGYAQQALNRPVAQRLLRGECTALVIEGVAGCLVDLPRVARLLDVPTIWLVDEQLPPPADVDSLTRHWLADTLNQCNAVVAAEANAVEVLQQWQQFCPQLAPRAFEDIEGTLFESLAQAANRFTTVRLRHLRVLPERPPVTCSNAAS